MPLPDKIPTKNLAGDDFKTLFYNIIYGLDQTIIDQRSEDDEIDDVSKAIKIDGTPESATLDGSPESSDNGTISDIDETVGELSKLAITDTTYDMCEGLPINFESHHGMTSDYEDINHLVSMVEMCPYLRLCNISPDQLAQVNEHLKRCV